MEMGTTEQGALQGAGTGFSIGGPWGAVAGAVLGGILGNRLGAEQQREQERARKEQALINAYAPLFGQPIQPLGMRKNFTNAGTMSGLMGGYQMGRQLAQDFKENPYQAPDSSDYLPIQTAPATPAPVPIDFGALQQSQFNQPFTIVPTSNLYASR